MPKATADRTDPKLWDRVKDKVMRGDKGGEPGQWSARKAQLATAEYKKAGGGYRGKKDPENHLAQWTEEEWGRKSGERSKDTGERYLPKTARKAMTDKEYAETSAKKRADTAKGKQHSPQPKATREKAAAARKAPAARKTESTKKKPAPAAGPKSADKAKTTRRKPAPSAGAAAKAKGADKVTEIRREFREAVNMTPAALAKHLKTERSLEVGFKRPGSKESVGHEMGAKIVELLRRKDAEEFSADDVAAMKKVVGYVKRHAAQRPDGDLADSNWRISLMNWGHDPLKKA